MHAVTFVISPESQLFNMHLRIWAFWNEWHCPLFFDWRMNYLICNWISKFGGWLLLLWTWLWRWVTQKSVSFVCGWLWCKRLRVRAFFGLCLDICFIWFGSNRHLVDSWSGISVLFQKFYRVSMFQSTVTNAQLFLFCAHHELGFWTLLSALKCNKNQPLQMEVLSDILYSE